MQYIEGRNVRQLVNGRPLSLESALSIALQTADALAAAHARGIIHRDIKAGNVMVTPTGQVKVLDFGLAKLLDEEQARTSGIHHTEITEVGVPYGTATYAAPESFSSRHRLTAAADTYSLGIVLFELLAGQPPFAVQTLRQLAACHQRQVPPDLRQIRLGLSHEVAELVRRMLAKEPLRRPSDEQLIRWLTELEIAELAL